MLFMITFSYSFYVKVVRDGVCIEIKVCFKAMMRLFYITDRRMQTFQDCRLEKLYKERLPVSLPKQQDVLSLLDFCKPESRIFFENLPTGSITDPLVSSFDWYEDRSEQIDDKLFM